MLVVSFSFTSPIDESRNWRPRGHVTSGVRLTSAAVPVWDKHALYGRDVVLCVRDAQATEVGYSANNKSDLKAARPSEDSIINHMNSRHIQYT